LQIIHNPVFKGKLDRYLRDVRGGFIQSDFLLAFFPFWSAQLCRFVTLSKFKENVWWSSGLPPTRESDHKKLTSSAIVCIDATSRKDLVL